MVAYRNSPADIAGYIRVLLELLCVNFRRFTGKPRWAEKTPANINCFLDLDVIFPDAKFLHVVRDGRDVACSILTMNWGAHPPARNFAEAAEYWVRTVSHGLTTGQHPSMAGKFMTVRYEPLVTNSEATLREVFTFLDEQWDPAVLNYHQKDRSNEPEEFSKSQIAQPIFKSSIGRWKMDMGPKDKADFKRIAGPLLTELGYAQDDAW
jgi:hypothetical protein